VTTRLYRTRFAFLARKSLDFGIGSAGERNLLGFDVEKKNRALPRGPGVSAGGRGETRLRCWAGRAGCRRWAVGGVVMGRA